MRDTDDPEIFKTAKSQKRFEESDNYFVGK
jgi:hypothetical protein